MNVEHQHRLTRDRATLNKEISRQCGIKNQSTHAVKMLPMTRGERKAPMLDIISIAASTSPIQRNLRVINRMFAASKYVPCFKGSTDDTTRLRVMGVCAELKPTADTASQSINTRIAAFETSHL